jgi:hypothetical protein
VLLAAFRGSILTNTKESGYLRDAGGLHHW